MPLPNTSFHGCNSPTTQRNKPQVPALPLRQTSWSPASQGICRRRFSSPAGRMRALAVWPVSGQQNRPLWPLASHLPSGDFLFSSAEELERRLQTPLRQCQSNGWNRRASPEVREWEAWRRFYSVRQP